jgi:hypothetical protein
MYTKKFLIFPLILLFFGACSKEPEPKLQLSGQDAFAFDIGEGWEVNASVTAKGFKVKEIEEKFLAKLSYSVDLFTPESDTLIAIYSDIIEKSSDEEISDMILEAQLEIDSSFVPGIYKLVYNVKDDYSNQIKSIAIDFELSK